ALKQDEYLLERLNRAYDHALTLGFTDIKVITQFLYQEAFEQVFVLLECWMFREDFIAHAHDVAAVFELGQLL
ncbi:MAG: hypothetical protein RL020_1956, partial [Pseudomonadota bacterium]